MIQLAAGRIDIGLTSTNADEAYRLYQAAFDRMPDDGGLRYWTRVLDSGASVQAIAGGFMGSAEFQMLYGSNPTNSAFVRSLHRRGRRGVLAGPPEQRRPYPRRRPGTLLGKPGERGPDNGVHRELLLGDLSRRCPMFLRDS
jgi:hypothetical protein